MGRMIVAAGFATALALAPGGARADVLSDQTAAIVVYPKLVVDTSNGLDTIVRMSNVSSSKVTMQCFYVNATPECVGGTGNCIVEQRFADVEECDGTCEERWQETDFRIVLTQNQPVAWLVSSGAIDCRSIENGDDLDPNNNDPCFPLDGIFRQGPGGESNAGSRIPPVAEDPFIGELKCIAVDDNDQPVERNVVHGSATIVQRFTLTRSADVAIHNAVGIQAIPGTNNGDRTLVLGRAGDAGVEYNGCPNILILDHFFDFAEDPVVGGPVTTDLTLVPCTQDFLRQETFRTPVQFLVFNEFEQRFSTSIPVECYRNIQISNIDTRVNNRSIFSAQVSGTLTGQTRIRGVASDEQDIGHTLVGVAEEFRPTSTGAFNLHFQGVREQRDFIYLP